MKKKICWSIVILCICINMMQMLGYAKTAEYTTIYNNLYVEGKTKPESMISLIMRNSDNGAIGYISQTETDSDGTYAFKFKFNDDPSKYILQINDGNNDISNTVVNTKEEQLYVAAELINKEIIDNTINLDIFIKNKYSDNGKCMVLYVSYDENNNLMGVVTENISYGYLDTTVNLTNKIDPAAYKTKIMVWQNLVNCIPLSKPDITLPSKNFVLVGDSLGQTYGENSCQKGWGEIIDNYLIDSAKVYNYCYAGWDTEMYLNLDKGWNNSKKQLSSGDVVIFGLGYNDYTVAGYNGKYYENVNGEKKYYKYGGDENTTLSELKYDVNEDENGKYIVNSDNLKIYYPNGINLETEKTSMMTYLYKDDEGTVQSYAADAFYDNMKEMLDDCKEIGVDVFIRNIAAICSQNAQTRESGFFGYVTQSIINEKIIKLANEYDNVYALDLYSATKNVFSKTYEAADINGNYSYYDENGILKPFIREDLRLQALADEYWLTIKNYEEFYGDGEILQNADGSFSYRLSDGKTFKEDTLHYNKKGADLVAKLISQLIKEKDISLSEYIK